MKLATIDGFSFDFPDALSAFKFDEPDRSKDTFHGLPMKAVDVVVELKEAYLFIEIKRYDDPSDFDTEPAPEDDDRKKHQDNFKWLKNNLKQKYRDTYLYRHAEEKVDKPIHYICLLNLDNAQNSLMQKILRRELPVGIASKRWKHEIVASCQVLDEKKWNLVFPKWHLTQLPSISTPAGAGSLP